MAKKQKPPNFGGFSYYLLNDRPNFSQNDKNFRPRYWA